MRTVQENLAARFLLGKLTEEENIKIETEVFSENKHFEDMLIAENELIDAYVKGELSPEDKTRFESRLLLNPKQSQRVDFAQTLIKYASSVPTENENLSVAKSNWWTAFLQFFSAKPLFSYSFAVAAFVFFTGVIWLAVNSNSSQLSRNNELASVQAPATAEEAETPKSESAAPFEQEKSADKVNPEIETPKNQLLLAESSPKVNKTQPAVRNEKPAKSAAIISTIVLPLGLTRDDTASSKAFDIAAKTDFVNLKLNLEDDNSFVSYFAVLETVEGQQIWNGKIVKSAKTKNQNSVTATIPARLLKKGDYILTIKGLTKDRAFEPAGDYSFTINRK